MKEPTLLALFLAFLSICRALKCPACSKRRTELEAMRLDAVKLHLLSKLGLSAAPNTTGRVLPKIPPLLSMLQSQDLLPTSATSEDDYHARTERMIVFPTRENEFLSGKPRTWWYFDLARKKSHLKVARAALWVYLKKDVDADKNGSYFNFNIYQGLYPLDENNVPAKSLVVSRQFSGNESGWRHFKLKRVVNGWVQGSHRNMGLFVELVGAHPGKITFPGDESNLQPFLVLHTHDTGNKRRAKRLASLDCDSPNVSPTTTCCRHPLTINFALIGWDFVIAPKTYEASYCTGDCSSAGFGLHTYYYHHFVQKEKRRLGEESKFCCSPNKVAPITMLYVVDDKIVYAKVPGMRIESCGCA